MISRPVGRRPFLVRGFAAALAITSVPPSTSAQSDTSPTLDGSSARSFEASVAALQNALPERRREDFEIALAVIWTRHTLTSGDLDEDGDVDSDDGRKLADDVVALLADIQRGDILSAIENRGGNEYAAADYFEQLDGLGFDEVVDLAGRPSEDPYFDALMRDRSEGRCRRNRSADRLKWCDDDLADSPAPLGLVTAKALNEAMQALNTLQYAEARSPLEALTLDRLRPYERSAVEQILYVISYAEEKYAEAREHLQNAIVAGGLNEQQAAEAVRLIRDIDTRLAESAP